MKAKVNPKNAGAEVLSIRRTRRQEILLVLKKGDDVSTFEKALDQAIGEKPEVKSLVSKRSLEVRVLDETVTREEVVAALLNLGSGKEAQNLLMQTARERMSDVLLISEQHKWSENSAWYQDASRRAGILVCSPI